MKNKFVRISLVALISAVFFYACADTDTPQTSISLNYSMDKWMKANRPDVQFRDSGYYYNIYEKHAEGDTLKVQDTCTIMVNIEGRLLDGTYFLNMDTKRARILGTFSYKTRYTPFRYISYNYDKYTFTNIGLNAVLRNMKVGDSAEVFLSPKNMAYTEGAELAQYEGFGGSSNLTSKDIAQYNISLKAIELNPLDSTLKRTIDFAVNKLNLKARDSIKKGLYVARIDSIGGGNFLGERDTVVEVRYTGRFLDDFVFDTNDVDVAKEVNIYSETEKYAALTINNSLKDEDFKYIKAFKYAFKKLKAGDKAVIVTIPEWAYGEKGKYNATGTLIPSYSPMYFEIEIL